MEALRVARLVGVRVLAALLVAGGAVVILTVRLLKNVRPSELVDRIRARTVLWPWLTNSSKLVLGTLAYNAFVFLVVQPILRRWFPPLKPWEHIQGIFGSPRTTYEDIVPVVATVLWIAGNALVITLLRANGQKTPADGAQRRLVS